MFELDALGCSAVEIGERLGMPQDTVEWKLKEARKKLARGLTRLREDRAEATRVRGVLWPFAVAEDREARRARVGLLVLVPALLSVHLVLRPQEPAWVLAASVVQETSARAAVAAVLPAARAVELPVAVPLPASIPLSRRSGPRRWLEYRVIVGTWRRQQMASSDAASAGQP